MNNELINNLVNWIKEYVENAHSNGVVIGMSGGKDSLVCAKLCSLALGKENVHGVIMPNDIMSDKMDAIDTCNLLEIPYNIIDISKYYNPLIEEIENILKAKADSVTTINTAPRLRMTTLYALAGSLNCLVVNTSNLSETMIGYSTKWGDNVGDFSPLSNLTKSEVCELGLLLGLPNNLVNKVPSDGLSGKSDEAKLGFTYTELDNYIRKGIKGEHFDIIEKKFKINAHKRNPISRFNPNLKNYFLKEE